MLKKYLFQEEDGRSLETTIIPTYVHFSIKANLGRKMLIKQVDCLNITFLRLKERDRLGMVVELKVQAVLQINLQNSFDTNQTFFRNFFEKERKVVCNISPVVSVSKRNVFYTYLITRTKQTLFFYNTALLAQLPCLAGLSL